MLTDAVVCRAALATATHSSQLRRHWSNGDLTESRLELTEERVSPIHVRHRVTTAIELSDPRGESPAESCSYGHMVLAKLPRPSLPTAIRTRHGVVYPNFWWERFQLAGEYDDCGKYGDADRAVDASRNPGIVVSKVRDRMLARGWNGERARG